MEKVGIGVIGCGKMGMVVVRDLLKQDPRIEIRGVFDPDPRSIQKGLEELGPNVQVYSDYQDLLSSHDIQWVMIASWNCYHEEQIINAFRKGKDIFCQKPLAINLESCLSVQRAWKEYGGQFVIGFTLRYSPHYRKIKQLIDEKAIGDIISLEFNETLEFNHGGYIMGDWRRQQNLAGTHLLEKCCHDMDIANWIVDSLAVKVSSFGGLNFFIPKNAKQIEKIGKNKDGVQAYRALGGLVDLNPFTSDKDIIDNQVAIVEYENGVRATFHTNCNAAIPERRMYILGTEGAIRADVLTGVIELKRIGFETPLENMSTGAKGGHGEGDEVLAKELADCILKKSSPSAGFDDGLKSAITCFAIDESMVTQKVVDVRPYWQKSGFKTFNED